MTNYDFKYPQSPERNSYLFSVERSRAKNAVYATRDLVNSITHKVPSQFGWAILLTTIALSGCETIGPKLVPNDQNAATFPAGNRTGPQAVDAHESAEARVSALVNNREYQAALGVLDEHLDVGDVGLAQLRAAILLELGRINEAIELLSKIVATQPSKTSAQLLLAYAFVDAGNSDAAVKHFRAVLDNSQITDERAATHLGLASLEEQSGNQATADHHYAAALVLDPDLKAFLVAVQKEILLPVPITAKSSNNNVARRKHLEHRVQRLREKKK